jgi:hypothetical protein
MYNSITPITMVSKTSAQTSLIVAAEEVSVEIYRE